MMITNHIMSLNPPKWFFGEEGNQFNCLAYVNLLATYSYQDQGSFFPSFPWCLPSGLCSVLFSVPGIYVETYVYDDVYIRLLMTSYLRKKPYIGSSGAKYFFPSTGVSPPSLTDGQTVCKSFI